MTQRHLRLAEMLAAGMTITAACKQLGIKRDRGNRVVARPDFQVLVREIQRRVAGDIAERVTKKFLSQAEPALDAAIKQMQAGSWKATRWFLDRHPALHEINEAVQRGTVRLSPDALAVLARAQAALSNSIIEADVG
ncbi:MAG: hypothetical protein C5B48_10570 [Candidatus Rokuibacteriota bacterium]|nr:MAG: hypothetical protein C5B48_10570 [Candidatus Rokubacteria bacterium]